MDTDILIKNEYYTKGLIELKVKNYWKEYKFKILNELNKSSVLLWICTDINKTVVKRNTFGKSIKLDKNNWDDIIHARVIQISKELDNITDEIVFDIDAKDVVSEQMKKEVVSDMILYITKNSFFNRKTLRVVNTSNSYNIICKTVKKFKKVDMIPILKESLEVELKDKNIGIANRKSTIINIDFTALYSRGSHVVPYSLNRNGTMCMDITNSWETWNRKSSILY